MKVRTLKIHFGLATAAAIITSMGQVHAQDAGKYPVDPSHSSVGFEIPHLVISTVEGKFKEFTGTIEIAKKFTDSKVDASAKISSIDTGVKDRDDHLRSKDFFEADKYPEMTFKSTKIVGTQKSFKLHGDLKIKDQTKPVVFDASFLGAVKDGYNNDKVAFKATTVISRKEFGLTWNNVVEAGPVVGDKVTITLKIQGAKEKAKEGTK